MQAVCYHQPMYNSNTAHANDGAGIKAALELTFYNIGVDISFSGHVHAYERNHRVYNGQRDAKAPVYITIGDGGNREGLYTKWKNPQPAYSAFRQASYGHGELQVFNATHMFWSWHVNTDKEPTVSDGYGSHTTGVIN